MNAATSRLKLFGGATGLIFCLGVILIFFSVDPSRRAIFPACQFHRLTGLNCPGCGGLRATHHLLHGRIATAFRHNLLVVIVPPLLLIGGIGWWKRRQSPRAKVAWQGNDSQRRDEPDRQSFTTTPPPHVGGRAVSAPKKNWRVWPWVMVAGLIALYGVLRNLPHPAFTWMSP